MTPETVELQGLISRYLSAKWVEVFDRSTATIRKQEAEIGRLRGKHGAFERAIDDAKAGGRKNWQRAEQAEAENNRLAVALQKIADWDWTLGPKNLGTEIARSALKGD